MLPPALRKEEAAWGKQLEYMDFSTIISLETKQILSQKQVESLNILSMSLTDLHSFLQTEEIENPLLEYSMSDSPAAPETAVMWENDSFYGRKSNENDTNREFYQMSDNDFSLEDLVYSQLNMKNYSEMERSIMEMAVNSLDDNGYLSFSAKDIALVLKQPAELVEKCLEVLKRLEPRGIFAADLTECLKLQVEGMEQEEELKYIISGHLQDVAEGKISNISRNLKISSAQVRKLIHVIKRLNPKPLNGYSSHNIEYIIPDIVFRYVDSQWFIELNDQWAGRIGINDFYVHMMNTTEDDELKKYFENKLKRARFITKCIEQRRSTLTKIAQYILSKQSGYFLDQASLQPMTLEEVATAISLNKSTISRAIKEKYISSPKGCMAIKDLFTIGLSSSQNSDEVISRNVVKDLLKAVIEGENRTKPYSDEKLAAILNDKGIEVSRRTVAKYRTELGIAGAFARKITDEDLL